MKTKIKKIKPYKTKLGLLFWVYIFAIGLTAAFTWFLIADRSLMFWIAYGCALFSIFASSIAFLAQKKRISLGEPFAIAIGWTVVNLYPIAGIVLLITYVRFTSMWLFILVQITAFILWLSALMLLGLGKKHAKRIDTQINSGSSSILELCTQLDNIQAKVTLLPLSVRTYVSNKLSAFSEEISYSASTNSWQQKNEYDEIKDLLERLNTEMDELIYIEADTEAAVEPVNDILAKANQVLNLIKQKNKLAQMK